MGIFDELFSSDNMLNEQISRQIFSVLGEDGLHIALVDRSGYCWASDTERFQACFSDTDMVDKLCERVDDGAELFISQIDTDTVVVDELRGEGGCLGHAMLIMPGYTAEKVLENFQLVELVLGYISLITGLVEKNNQIHHLQLKRLTVS